jgi:hypothetical protein
MLTSVVLVLFLLSSPLTIGVLVLWSAHRGYMASTGASAPKSEATAQAPMAEAA